jgi:hypothetical protein
VGSSPEAGASCPRNKAAKLGAKFYVDQTTFDESYRFDWYQLGEGQWNFAQSDELVLDLAFIPFRGTANDPNSSTAIWMNTESGIGTTFFSLSFSDGTVAPTDLSYSRAKWNDVRVRFDFDAQEFTVVVNGERSDPHDFDATATVTDVSSFEFGLFDTYEDKPRPAWLDAISLTKKTTGGDEVLFSAQFDADPDYTASYGTMEFVNPATRELAQGACLTSTSLNIEKTRRQINASGRVLPPHPENSVIVSLFKKKDDQFVKISTKEPGLDGDSRYATGFSRPGNTDRCRVRARFPAGSDYQGSSAEKTFDC